ncbi:MAG: hypothetical protein ACYCZZ_02100 [Minisyncoccota bacterium]
MTKIERKKKEKRGNNDEREATETLPGLVIFSLSTDKGTVKINY